MKTMTLHIDSQTRCNVRCKQCHIWRTRTSDPIDVKYLLTGIADFAKHCRYKNIRGVVSIAGGEPFLDQDRTFALLDCATTNNLHSVVVSNGTCITSDVVQKLYQTRCKDINISIDGPEELHDNLRGVPGTFQRAIHAIQSIKSANTFKQVTRVHVATTAMKPNMHCLVDIAQLSYKANADSWSLQMYSPEFSSNSGVANTSNLWFDDAELEQGQQALLGQFRLLVGYGSFWQQNNTATIGRFIQYMTPHHVTTCVSHESNVFIDPFGDIMLCLFSNKVFPEHRLGNLETRGLADVLTSRSFIALCDSMSLCSKRCSVLNCHWK